MAEAEPSSRRPLKSRQWAFFQALADRLARAGVSPNAISVLSVVFAVAAGLCLAGTGWAEREWARRALWLLSAALIQGRLIANLLDGMVAVEGGLRSAVGELYNEVPDRISDPAILIGAGCAAGGDPMLGLLAALVAVFVAYVRAIGASVGAGQDFAGPMAKQQRMATVTVVCLYCAVTPASWQPALSGGQGVMAAVLLLILLGGALTSVRRLRRIAQRMKQRAEEE